MAGRNRMPRQHESFRDPRDVPPPIMHRGPGPLPPHPVVLEEELEFQHREIRRLVAENAHVHDDNVHLQRELAAVREEILTLGQIIPKMHADRDIRARELTERARKLEAEVHAAEPLKAEVLKLRGEARKLNFAREDLANQIQILNKDVTRMQDENSQLQAMKANSEAMHKELINLRREFEVTKKSNEEHVRQKEVMEKNLISMAREVEKLRSEQLGAERRSHGTGAGAYGVIGASPETRYPGSAYSDVYGAGAWGSYDRRGPPRR